MTDDGIETTGGLKNYKHDDVADETAMKVDPNQDLPRYKSHKTVRALEIDFAHGYTLIGSEVDLKFKRGEVVRLKSGGPIMTVSDIRPSAFKPDVTVVKVFYFDLNNMPQTTEFADYMLDSREYPPEKPLG